MQSASSRFSSSSSRQSATTRQGPVLKHGGGNESSAPRRLAAALFSSNEMYRWPRVWLTVGSAAVASVLATRLVYRLRYRHYQASYYTPAEWLHTQNLYNQYRETKARGENAMQAKNYILAVEEFGHAETYLRLLQQALKDKRDLEGVDADILLNDIVHLKLEARNNPTTQSSSTNTTTTTATTTTKGKKRKRVDDDEVGNITIAPAQF